MRTALILGIGLGVVVTPDIVTAGCAEDVTVVGATVTYQTRMFQGRPTRRDASVQVELRSTSTTAISGIELAVFLGASLQAVEATRASALPTVQPRILEEGGLAFRSHVDVVLPANASRTVVVARKALPMDQDLYGVKTVIVGCSRAHAVGDVRLVMPAGEHDPPGWLLVAALVLTIAIAMTLVWRLR